MVLDKYNLSVNYDDGYLEESLLDKFEIEIGYNLPQEYKNIISQHNSLYLNEPNFEFINFYNEKDIGACYFYGYGTPTENITEANTHFEDPEYYGEKGIITFGLDANGDNVCFDYRDDLSTDNPKIVYVYHDRFEELPDGRVRNVINHVANSFEDFLGILFRYEDKYDDYGNPL